MKYLKLFESKPIMDPNRGKVLTPKSEIIIRGAEPQIEDIVQEFKDLGYKVEILIGNMLKDYGFSETSNEFRPINAIQIGCTMNKSYPEFTGDFMSRQEQEFYGTWQSENSLKKIDDDIATHEFKKEVREAIRSTIRRIQGLGFRVILRFGSFDRFTLNILTPDNHYYTISKTLDV